MIASSPPVVLTTAGIAAWSLVRNSTTVPVVTVLKSRAPLGKKKSAVTAASRETLVAPLAGAIVVTEAFPESRQRCSNCSTTARLARLVRRVGLRCIFLPDAVRRPKWLHGSPCKTATADTHGTLSYPQIGLC